MLYKDFGIRNGKVEGRQLFDLVRAWPETYFSLFLEEISYLIDNRGKIRKAKSPSK